jgi:phage terminase small subunit
MELTPKQERFVAEYLIDLNATQAAIRTGYSAKTAASQGARLLKQGGVARAVQAAQQARAVRTEITQDRVLQELARIAFFDIRRLYRADGSMKDPCELDADTAAALASIEVKEELERGGGEDALQEPLASAAVSATVSAAGSAAHGGAPRRRRGEQVAGYTIKTRVFDKVATLQLAMRHLGMLNDKLGLSAPGGGPIETVAHVTRTIIDPQA